MNHLFTANLNNEVVAFASNLEDFVIVIHELLPTSQQYALHDFVQKFEDNSIILFSGSADEEYNLQEVF